MHIYGRVICGGRAADEPFMDESYARYGRTSRLWMSHMRDRKARTPRTPTPHIVLHFRLLHYVGWRLEAQQRLGIEAREDDLEHPVNNVDRGAFSPGHDGERRGLGRADKPWRRCGRGPPRRVGQRYRQNIATALGLGHCINNALVPAVA